jgi:phage-related protein
MEHWVIEFINDEAEKELLSLDSSFKAKFVHIPELIEKYGPFSIGMPHISSLGDKLWEIRMKAKQGIARSIFFVNVGKKIIVLHTFIKKTQKTPKRHLDIAKSRLKEIRYDN